MGQTLYLHTWMINIDEFAKMKLRRQIQIKKKKKELQRQIQQKLADLNQAQEESDVQSAKVGKAKKPEKKLSSAETALTRKRSSRAIVDQDASEQEQDRSQQTARPSKTTRTLKQLFKEIKEEDERSDSGQSEEEF